mmetsp:Transcript_18400/g.28705  ORF Transcript_18400/g.28705 Transcript_18400/m.28705 type:complete len:536 (-) Transcript_18400:58-1665(-)
MSTVIYILRFGRDSLGEFNRFQLRISKLRGGADPFGRPHMKNLGLMRDGFPADSGILVDAKLLKSEWKSEGSVTLTYDRPIAINGFWFQIRERRPELDPISYSMFAANCNVEVSPFRVSDCGNWTLVGASRATFRSITMSWTFTDAPQLPAPEPARLSKQIFDFRIPKFLGSVLVLRSVCLASSNSLISILAYAKREQTAVMVAVYFMLPSVNFFYLLAVVGCQDEQDCVTVGSGAIFSILISWAVVAGSWFVYLAALSGVWGLLCCGVVWIWYGWQAVSMPLVSSSAVFAVANIRLILSRRKLLQESFRLMEKDRAMYDKVFKELQQTEKALLRLQDQVAKIEENIGPVPSRMSQQAPVAAVKETAELVDVDSLHKLFLAAAMLHPILIDKAKFWAEQSKGSFSLSSAHGTTKPKFARIKNVERACEKVIRTYSGRVKHLVDICRQSIIFDTVEDLATCLSLIARDGEAQVLRLKNRLDPGFDSTKSSGYRDVQLNIRLKTQESLKQGVWWHIAELQLLIRSFAELKRDEGHRR